MTKFKFIEKHAKSLRTQLFWIFLLLGIVPMLLYKGIGKQLYINHSVSALSIEVLTESKLLVNAMLSCDYLSDVSSEVINAQLVQLSNIYDGRVLVIDETFQIVEDTYQLDEGKTIVSEEVIQSFGGEEISNYDSENNYIEMTIPLRDTKTEEVKGVMLVSVSTDSVLARADYIDWFTTIFLVADVLIVVGAAFFLSSSLVKPFGKVKKSIEDVQNGYQETNVLIEDYTETKQISEACLSLLSRMKTIDDSRQEFVSNVSHELKTPLTSMKVLADSLNGQEDVPMELYKEFMADIGDEIERENKIINDLLSLVKMDRSAADVNIASVSINDLLELILKRLRPIAERQGVDLVLESFRPVTAEVDEVKLTLAISNLVENAIKYNKPEGGWVHVTLNADHQYFYVTVEDSGIGIPEDSVEHIYERFYRVDKSHSREIGGTGLGLAITRNAIVVHRGAIKVHSKEGEGTIFTVRIPLNYIA